MTGSYPDHSAKNEPKKVPFENSYWVQPGLLLAGEYPARTDSADDLKRLKALAEIGIHHFIDLTEDDQTIKYWENIADLEAFKGDEHSHKQFYVQDYSVPSTEKMIEILDVIDAAVEAGEPAYVHCHAGIGRTGTVIGCYLVRHGLKPGEAVEAIANLRMHTPYFWRSSPETTEQFQFIQSWKNGQ